VTRSSQKGEQNVTASENDRSELQEDEEQRPERHRIQTTRARHDCDERRPDEDEQRRRTEKRRDQRHAGDREEKSRPRRGSPQTPKCLHDQRDDDRLDPVKNGGGLRQRSKAKVGPRDGGHQERCRQDEAGAAGDQAGPASVPETEVDGELRRARTGDEIRRAEQIQELLAREPLAAADRLVLHHGDVRRGPTERSEP